ncbi:hypothetical protein CK203_083824 [Vitis vinifera]|uniref:Reverse transcriptase/retrotransposon-derived protein RNase H-like domain-containing protein n=1 Tax=Vitis vinifera TaxID=29760 RepID=A0A438DLT6_VITVI|nr:hypothetical protein CK203_083824 [Vitis vinifera]
MNVGEQAFDEVKHYLTKSPILSSPHSGEQLYMYLAVFDCAISVVLFCHVKDKEQRLVYYVTKTMVDVETQYSIIEQTTLAMKSAA